jgi:hypothetical protein
MPDFFECVYYYEGWVNKGRKQAHTGDAPGSCR